MIVFPRFARARMAADLCPDFHKPICNNVPSGFGKNGTVQLAFPDLLSNHAPVIEEEVARPMPRSMPRNDSMATPFTRHAALLKNASGDELLAFLTTVALFPIRPLFSHLTWVGVAGVLRAQAPSRFR